MPDVIDKQDLPEKLRDVMYPDERIVWIQRGHGLRWPLIYTAPPVAYALGMALLIWLLIVGGADAGFVIMVAIGAIWWLGMIAASYGGIIFGPRSEYYVLSDARILHHRSFPTHSTRSLAAREAPSDSDFCITRLTVWGRRDQGWIMLRSEEYRARPFRLQLFPHYVTSLVGVEQPKAVAALIKTTLNLEFEIEDHTR